MSSPDSSPIDSPTDSKAEGLWQQASRGDEAALDELLVGFMPRLEAFVRLRMGTTLQAKESVSDIVQSVCRELLDGQEHFEFRGVVQFQQWLFTATQRKVADRYEYYLGAAKRDVRREVPKASGHTDGNELEMLTPSRDAGAREEVERVEAALHHLSEEAREVILLTKFQGLSVKQAAEQLGRTHGSTRTLLWRALSQLAEVMSTDGEQ